MGFQAVKKEDYNPQLEKIKYHCQSKQLADNLEQFLINCVQKNNSYERINEYTIECCRGIIPHWLNYDQSCKADDTIVESVLWHQETNWKYWKNLFEKRNYIWNQWKKKNLIPHYIIVKAEEMR